MSWPLAAVFDFDGLLADTAACWQQAYADVLARSGRALDAVLADRLTGASVPAAAAELGVPTADLHRSLRQAFERGSPPALPGAARLVSALSKRMPLAVATNAPHELVAGSLRRLGMGSGVFSAVISAGPPQREKPYPDVYLAACEALGVAPAQAAALEDSAVGVLAAQRAGLAVVRVCADGQNKTSSDLHVTRLDDSRLLRFLGLPGDRDPGGP